jgi:Protein of unknown function (DUF2971)
MWAHSADKHTGVCLHFRCQSQSLFGLARRVIYSNARQPILIPLSYNTEGDMVDRMVYLKSGDWEYEKGISNSPARGWHL